MKDMRRVLLSGFLLLGLSLPSAHASVFYQQENLVSNVPGMAKTLDPNLVNPWGISRSSSSPFWVSNQVTGTSTLYNGAGNALSLVVTIPKSAPNAVPAGPTGQVFNGTADFVLGNNNPATFIFAALDGTISAWNGGTSAELKVLSTSGAIYTGLTKGLTSSGNVLFAADTFNNKIDVYDTNFASISPAGSFLDPTLPSNVSVYNVENVGGTLYATYTGPGGDIVDRFDLEGNFLGRFATGGTLNGPWGVVQAPASFGPFGGSLLIGNEEDGRINAFALDGTFLGQLSDEQGNPITNTGLWGLSFGNGGNGGDTDTLYFAAGINNEQDGLFGAIRAVPEPGSMTLFALGTCLALLGLAKRRRITRRE